MPRKRRTQKKGSQGMGTDPQKQSEMFQEQDLEFRTITTLLHALGSNGDVKVEKFTVPSNQRSQLKHLHTLSLLLVRDHEIVAILPKRSSESYEFFVGSQVHIIPRNPRYDDPDPQPNPVKLLQPDIVTVGSDIENFIVNNWDQAFDHHVQSFADLLNNAIKDFSYTTELNLRLYSLIQSAPKVHRRFMKSTLSATVKLGGISLPPSTNTATLPLLSTRERDLILITLSRSRAKKLHSNLFRFLNSRPPTPTPPSLVEFHDYFKWLLLNVIEGLRILRRLHNKRPKKLQINEITILLFEMDIVSYFAWKSEFFKDYIQAVSRNNEGGKTIPNSAERQGEDFEREGEDTDFPTEQETGEERIFKAPANSQSPPSHHHEWILDLRLLTSNTYHLGSLLEEVGPTVKFSFKAIKYSKSDNNMKPWRNVIQELFEKDSDLDMAEKAVVALRQNCRKTYRQNFQPGGHPIEFKGRAHCEAVLACLYTLAQDNDRSKSSWTKIPSQVLDEVKFSYNLVAPSKRCCPVCATIISCLSSVNTGRPQRYALSTHSVIFPCAFPTGLPQEVRKQLLKKYKGVLADRFKTLVGRGRTSSEDSRQSDPLSNEDKTKKKRVSAFYISSLIGVWKILPQREVARHWEGKREELEEEELAQWWALIPKDMKLLIKRAGKGTIR